MANTFTYRGIAHSTGFDSPLMVLFNTDTFGSGRKLTVVDVNVRSVKPSFAVAEGKFVKRRITAATGGDSVEIVKADTASANLPSQISIARNTDVTLATAIFSSRIVNPMPVSPFASRSTGTQLNISAIWATQRQEGSTQHLRLVPGEGIAILSETTVFPSSGTYQLNCIIKIGSELHYINTEFHAYENPTAYFSIMNNTGSGVNVDVVSLELMDIGSALITSPAIDAPYVGFKRIAGYQGGEELTPVPSSTEYSLHASTKLVRGRIFNPISFTDAGAIAGSVSRYAYGYPSAFMMVARAEGLYRQQALYIMNRLDNTAIAAPANEFKANNENFFFKKAVSTTGIVLNPQEGFAVQMMNMSLYGSYYIEIEFTHTPPAAPPSGGLKSTVTLT